MTDRFRLVRQDDHGVRYEAGRFPDRPSAEARLAELTRSLHKQTYWIETLPPGEASGPTES